MGENLPVLGREPLEFLVSKNLDTTQAGLSDNIILESDHHATIFLTFKFSVSSLFSPPQANKMTSLVLFLVASTIYR